MWPFRFNEFEAALSLFLKLPFRGGIVILLGAHNFDNANQGEPIFYTVNDIIMVREQRSFEIMIENFL